MRIANDDEVKAYIVSIHAPVMGANTIELFGKRVKEVSIHAPVMGAKLEFSRLTCISRFNPRTRDGCEQSTQMICSPFCLVSIHAPVMGANTLF